MDDIACGEKKNSQITLLYNSPPVVDMCMGTAEKQDV